MSGVYLGVDVGTSSVRAALFERSGRKLGRASCEIEIFRPAEDFVEQSSENIWQSIAQAVREALKSAQVPPNAVTGLSFDATCSLVVLDANDQPLSVSPSGNPAQNVIVWMDHRALVEAEQINRTQHPVLRYVGGTISPEMEPPKLLWLKRHLPHTFQQAARFLDLADFLTYRATGNDTRSLCTTVCKWGYLGHEARWDPTFFEAAGLAEFAQENYSRIGQRVRPMGERLGPLSRKSAQELGLTELTQVGIGIIDAHAGGIGLLGANLAQDSAASAEFGKRLALIGGTSSCHMAVSAEPRFIPGIWGPYFSAMLPNMWLTEGGQSATGALIDHTIFSHSQGRAILDQAKAQSRTPYDILNQRLTELAHNQAIPASLTTDLHVLPDHHGNRSPRADAHARGLVSGLKLSDSVEQLALLYLATIQGIAHGTRHILDTLNAHGYEISALVACGGDTKNPIFVREHANITGVPLIIPKEPEAVLLGAAILGAVASGDFPSLGVAMTQMNSAELVIQPDGGKTAEFHAKKHQIFLRMYDDQLAYRRLMHA